MLKKGGKEAKGELNEVMMLLLARHPNERMKQMKSTQLLY